MNNAPLILAFDTSTAHCAAALLRGDSIIAHRVDDMGRGQAEHLIPMINEMLAKAGVTWAELTAIGVGIGPGNFTGIRISVAAARGLAMGLDIPAIGVSMFDTTKSLSNRAQTAVPAPRGQFYMMDFDKQVDPVILPAMPENFPVALSSEYSAADHITTMARLTAKRLDHPATSPAPLYVRPADAAPSRDLPPPLLD